MLAKAKKCEAAAYIADARVADVYRDIARRWSDMAAQLELLEREQVYRIIRKSLAERTESSPTTSAP
jgi:hypothetical protein